MSKGEDDKAGRLSPWLMVVKASTCAPSWAPEFTGHRPGRRAGPNSHALADSQPAAPGSGGEQAVHGDRPDGAYEGGDHQVAPQPRQGGPPHPLAVQRIMTEWAAAPAEVRQPRTEGPLSRQSPEACGGEPALPRRSREIGST